MWLSTLGWNFDLISWWIVATLVNEGKNVYVYTGRYNYGPIWAGVTWIALRIQHAFGLSGLASFHVFVAGFLTTVDIITAVTLGRVYGFMPAVLFLICPVSVLITGYHSQIDNIAILLALWSWCLLERLPEGDGQLDNIIWPAVLMGLSLATKHVFAFFPLWIVFWPSRPMRVRLLYAGIAYAIFLGAFIPYVLTPEELASVKAHVFFYQGWGHFGNALLPRMIPDQSLWTGAFAVGMLAAGFIISRWARRQLFFLYPVALVTLTTTMTDQYLVIPIISFAAYWRHLPMWAYVLTATAALIGSKDNVGSLRAMQSISGPLRASGFSLSEDARSTLFPQICLLLFLLSGPIAESIRHRLTRPRDSVGGSGAL